MTTETKKRTFEETFGDIGARLDELLTKERLDDLRVQAELGRMELRDRLQPTLRNLGSTLDRFGQQVGKNGEGVLDEVRAAVDEAVGEIRKLFDRASA